MSLLPSASPFTALALAILAATTPSTAPLTEATVAELARESSPTVAAASARSAASAHLADASARSRLPSVDLSLRYGRLSSIPDRLRTFEGIVFPQLLDSYAARVDVVVPLSEAFLVRAANARAAARDAEAAELEARVAVAEHVYAARLAFLDWSRARERVATAEARRASAERDARDAEARHDAGVIADSQRLTFLSARDGARLARGAAEAELRAAEATLRSYLPPRLRGMALEGTPLDVPLASCPAEAAPPHLVQLRAAGSRALAAEVRADAAVLALIPALSLTGSAELSAPNPRVFTATTLEAVPAYTLGVELTWSIGALPTALATIATTREESRAAAADAEALARRLEAERAASRAVLCSTPDRLTHADSRRTLGERLVAARRAELEAGSITAREVVAAEADLAEARDTYVEVLVGHAAALARLAMLDGLAEEN